MKLSRLVTMLLVAALCHGACATPPALPPPPSAPFVRPPQEQTMRMVPQLGHSGSIRAVAISEDGRFALSGSGDQSARLWDIETGLLLRVLHHDAAIYCVALTGKAEALQAVTAEEGGLIRIWDLTRDKPRDLRVPPHEKIRRHIQHMAVSTDGRIIAIGRGKEAWVLDAASGKPRRFVVDGFESGVGLAPDGGTLWVAAGRKIARFHTSTGKTLGTVELDGKEIRAAQFARDVAQAVVLMEDHEGRTRASLLDVDSGKLLADLGEADRYARAALAPAADWVLVGDSLWQRDRSGQTSRRGRAAQAGAVAAFSPDGQRFVAGGVMGALEIVEVAGGQRLMMLPSAGKPVRHVEFAGTDRLLVAGMDGTTAWDLRTLSRSELRVPPQPLRDRKIAPSPTDVRLLVAADKNREEKLAVYVHVGPYQPARELEGWFTVDAVTFSPDGATVAALGTVPAGENAAASERWKNPRRVLATWDVASGKRKLTLDAPGPSGLFSIASVAFSPDGALVAASAQGQIRLWDAKTGAIARTLEHGSEVWAIVFSPDRRLVLSGGADGTVKVWELPEGRLRSTLAGHQSAVQSLAMHPDGRLVVSGGFDNTARLWNLETGASVVLASRGEDWIAYGDDGFFDASRRGGALAAAVSGLQGHRVDQLAVRLNRPDILLERMKLGTPELIAELRALAERRVARSGAGSALRPPEARIRKLERRDRVAEIELELELEAGQADLSTYRVLVNDVPAGATASPASGKRLVTRQAIELSSGRNIIEVEAQDQAGLLSPRARRSVTLDTAPKRDLYFIGIGVSRYRDPRLELAYAAKDANDLAEMLRRVGPRHFASVHTATLVDEEVDAARIRELGHRLDGARVDDVVLMLVAGHGVHLQKSGEYVFLPHGADPHRLAETTVRFDELQTVLTRTPARTRLLLLDTCESGERDPTELAAAVARVGRRGMSARTARALVLAGREQNKPRITRERNRFIDGDLFGRSGAIVLTSSRGTEASLEDKAFENGVFTEHVMRALSSRIADRDGNGIVHKAELKTYVTLAVAASTDDLQHPVLERDNPDMDIALPILESASPAAGQCPDGYAFVPGGELWMGLRGSQLDQQPAHPVTVAPLCMMRTEVTVEAYDACMGKGVCPKLLALDGPLGGECNTGRADRKRHPINCVGFSAAQAFCEAAAARLPSEQEWEAAAGGLRGWQTPWGGRMPDATSGNACGTECVELASRALGHSWDGYTWRDKWPATAPSGSFPAGASPEGILDLAGNVWEWTSSRYCPYPRRGCDEQRRVIRGWGFLQPIGQIQFREPREPNDRDVEVGFRCVVDLK